MPVLPFLVALTLGLSALLAWAVRYLPGERWQMLASIPLQKNDSGAWECVNLTYYGFFLSAGVVAALAATVLLLASVGVPAWFIGLTTGATLLAGILASRGVARLVEGKKHTFTVAGALFVGSLTLPFVLGAAHALFPQAAPEGVNLTAWMAAALTGYAFGEGIGRLSCLSFGCCYGKPIHAFSSALQRWLRPIALRFYGPTKKIAYAEGMEGVAVFPVQALSAGVNFLAGLVGLALFLEGSIGEALAAVATVSMGWRFASEFLRADYRGSGAISAYQWMSLVILVAGIALGLLRPAGEAAPDLLAGLSALWHPGVLLALQGIGVALFFRFGRSTVTYARASYHVHSDRV